MCCLLFCAVCVPSRIFWYRQSSSGGKIICSWCQWCVSFATGLYTATQPLLASTLVTTVRLRRNSARHGAAQRAAIFALCISASSFMTPKPLHRYLLSGGWRTAATSRPCAAYLPIAVLMRAFMSRSNARALSCASVRAFAYYVLVLRYRCIFFAFCGRISARAVAALLAQPGWWCFNAFSLRSRDGTKYYLASLLPLFSCVCAIGYLWLSCGISIASGRRISAATNATCYLISPAAVWLVTGK
ncbi:hypothetical protein AVEN_110282-1 [Araneus ventricosus]|uniref:Uncharacterized protein n=1 Tax=Araneus ventricosus TaxID=182803 RepID=A0A4Y2DRH3_ARAVE|nr:hypothetical protein AVEN_110282-1 [Araneus ventricosus]